MARMRVFIVLALAIAAGGTFAFGTYRYMQNVPARTVEVPTSTTRSDRAPAGKSRSGGRGPTSARRPCVPAASTFATSSPARSRRLSSASAVGLWTSSKAPDARAAIAIRPRAVIELLELSVLPEILPYAAIELNRREEATATG